VPRDLSLDNVIAHIDKGVLIRKSLNLFYEHMTSFSQLELKIVGDALNDNN